MHGGTPSNEKAGAALTRGLSLVRRFPGDLLTIWIASILFALPLAVVMWGALEGSLGHSEAGARMVAGWDGLWFRSWEAQAAGVEKSFEPGIVGIGALLKGLDAMITGMLSRLDGAVLGAGMAYAGLWVVISGGLIARYLDPEDPPSLLFAGVHHFGRLLPLALVAGLAHVVIWLGVFPALHRMVEQATVDVIDERIAFAYALIKYGTVWTLAGLVEIVHGYAKVARVADPERSLSAAFSVALSLVWRRFGAVLWVAVAGLLAFVGVVLVYWLVAAGTDDTNPFKIFVAFGIGQASILARIGVRAWGHAARTSLMRADEAEA